MWNNSVEVEVLEATQNYIHTAVAVIKDATTWENTFIYAHPTFQHRRHLWDTLLMLKPLFDRPWVCVGDFNEVLSQQEKEGLHPQSTLSMNLFREFIDNAGLMDMELKGCRFTWCSNPRAGFVTRVRLDRVLANWSWREHYPHALASAFPCVSSDHSPVVLHPSPRVNSGRSFKFEALWEEDKDCALIINEGWSLEPNAEQRIEDPWDSVLKRTRKCAKALTNWHKEKFANAPLEISDLKKRLTLLQNADHARFDWEEVHQIKRRIKELWRQEEIFWGQRSRIKWLNWGDRNTSFFHASTIQRRESNRIHRIRRTDGSWIEGQSKISAEALEYYKQVFSAEGVSQIEECLSHVPSIVNQDLRDRLVEPVSEYEIKAAVFSLGKLKAPGPDGFNGLFYQNHWGTIKGDVCAAV